MKRGREVMIGTVWNNGAYHSSGAGYGIKIRQVDRDKYFDRNWNNVVLELGNKKTLVSVNINKSSFWSDCRELINKEIGIWLIHYGKGTWKKGKPPKVEIEQIVDNKFSINFI
jgi:hypothetical protein